MSEIYTDSTTARYKETYTLSSQSQLSEKNSLFTRDKYDLTGWIDSNGTQYSLGQTINPEGEVTISAQWLGKQYNVTLNKDGGTCTDLISYRYEQGATLPTNWTKEGYTFVGWKNNSELTGENFTEISADEYGDKEFWAASTSQSMPYNNGCWNNEGEMYERKYVWNSEYGYFEGDSDPEMIMKYNESGSVYEIYDTRSSTEEPEYVSDAAEKTDTLITFIMDDDTVTYTWSN